MKQEDEKLISVKEASDIAGYSRQHIVRLIKNDKIKAKRIGRSFVVYRDSLQSL